MFIQLIYFIHNLSLSDLVDIAGVLGFVMSLFGLVCTWHRNRKRLHISILDIKSFNDVTFLRIMFENKSRLPIAITRVALLLNGKIIDCTPNPTIVYEEVRRDAKKEIIGTDVEKSYPLPIQLSELGAISGLVLFERLQELPEDSATNLTFLIATNRGKAFQRTLELPVGWASRRNPF